MNEATATSPQVVAAKPRRGRRLASESRSDEHRERVRKGRDAMNDGAAPAEPNAPRRPRSRKPAVAQQEVLARTLAGQSKSQIAHSDQFSVRSGPFC